MTTDENLLQKNNFRLTWTREGYHYWLFALGMPLHAGYKDDCEIGWNRVSRTYDEYRGAPISDQSTYGRPDCYNIICQGEQVNPTQPWKTDCIGEDQVQPC